jgi:hypothetical protein
VGTTDVKRTVRRRLVATVGVARTVESFDRPAWLYRSRRAVPRGRMEFRSPQPITDSELALCRRLIDAYVLATTQAATPEGMWSHEIFRARQQALGYALDQRDPAMLAELLGSMFRSDFVLGIAPGSLVSERQSGPLTRLSWLAILNKLTSLAEASGAARVENPEQGAVGHAFADGIDGLVARIETRLGLSLNFPDVGAAYGVPAGDRLITPETPDQVYAAMRLRDVIGSHLPDAERPLRIVEIGGGYGAMAYWLLQMVDARYVIVDLPIVNVLQGYFLSRALGAEKVAFFGEQSSNVTICPDHALSSIETPFDVLANKDSMPEIPKQAMFEYLHWARQACTGLFYSYNQEAAAPFDGTPQNVVPEAILEVGGFARIRRDASWLRRGYAEEVYVLAA